MKRKYDKNKKNNKYNEQKKERIKSIEIKRKKCENKKKEEI